MGRRRGSRSWDALDKLAAAVAAAFVGAGVLARVAGGPTWLLIVLAAIGMTVLVVRVGTQWGHRSAVEHETRAAMTDEPRRLSTLQTADLYRLGVEQESEASLELIGEGGSASYRPRDCETRLRADVEQALRRDDATLVVVTGHSKAGKSRIALEALRRLGQEGMDAWLIVPRSRPEAVAELADRGTHVSGPVVIWLDDLEPYAQPQGLSPATLAAFACWPQPVVVLATAYGKGVKLAGTDGLRFQDTFNELVRRAEAGGHEHPLLSQPTERELADLRAEVGAAVADRIAHEGIGEFMIAASELVRRLEHGDSVEGRAIVRAAIDCRRAGVVDPIPVEWLQAVFRHYLPGPASDERFADGLRWATTPLYKNTTLLRSGASRAAGGDAEVYEPHDFVVSRQETEIEPRTWDFVADHAPAGDLFRIGALVYRSDLVRAERAFRRGDQEGEHLASFNLGVLLQARGDLDDAEAAYRRAEQGGSPRAAANLGVILKGRGDLDGAERAYRRGDEAGDATATFNLGILLRERGDLDGAQDAWSRGAEHGDLNAISNLGVLLRERGDLDGAEAAYRRADDLGSGPAAFNLGRLLHERGDLDGAIAAYGRADDLGNAAAALNLGVLLRERGDLDGAEAAWRRAEELGDSKAAFNLGMLLGEQQDLQGAEAAWRRAAELGDADAAFNVGVMVRARGDLVEAEAAMRRADELGSASAAFNVGVLLHGRGDLDGAIAAYRRAVERGDANATTNLGALLHERGDLDGAEAAWRLGDERDVADAAFNLGLLLHERGDVAGAEGAWERADRRGSGAAAFNLGAMLQARGDAEAADEAFERARERGVERSDENAE